MNRKDYVKGEITVAGHPCPEIGILAGMGPRSTAPFLDMVITQCQIQYGAQADEEFPAIMTYSLPTPFYLDRPLDHQRMAAIIKDGVKTLAATRVGLIAMPCGTAHAYWNIISAGVYVTFLNMIDETIAAIGGCSGQVALLATRAAIDCGVFQVRLVERGFEPVIDSSWQNTVDVLIRAVKANQDKTLVAESFSALLSDVSRKADTVVVACTDLSVLRPKPSPTKRVDAAEALAAAVVREYLVQRDKKGAAYGPCRNAMRP